jgi:galactokinase
VTQSNPRFDVIARAPGRVNLIGEHTDYQAGFVLPMAIGLATTVRARLEPGESVRLESASAAGVATFGPDDDPARLEPAWARCPAAAVRLLRAAGVDVPGFRARIEGDLPLGAGLSSSAALDVAVALAALEIARSAGRRVPRELDDRRRLAEICRDAEHRGSGVRCGIMDPYASLHGRAGSALLLDCRSVEARPVPIPSDRAAFVVADSGVRHSLAAGGYGDRRAECEEAARRLGVSTLRDATAASVAASADVLGPVLTRRARHVVTENARVLEAVAALETGAVEDFGRHVDASHDSLRDDFEVSCPELDELVDLARALPGVLGSRMIGGGFGGSALTVVRPEAADAVLAVFRARSISALRIEPAEGATTARS